MNDQEWCKAIYIEICERRRKQPILVICENLKRLNELESYLTSQDDDKLYEIIDYARDGDDVEKRFDSKKKKVART